MIFFLTRPGQLAAGGTVTKVFGPFPAISSAPTPGLTVSGLSHASIAAEYHIPNPNGSDSGFLHRCFKLDDVTLNVNEQADLSVTNSDSPDPVLLGKNVTYNPRRHQSRAVLRRQRHPHRQRCRRA